MEEAQLEMLQKAASALQVNLSGDQLAAAVALASQELPPEIIAQLLSAALRAGYAPAKSEGGEVSPSALSLPRPSAADPQPRVQRAPLFRFDGL